LGNKTSPFLKQVAERFGVTPESIKTRWDTWVEHVAHTDEDCLPENLSADGYKLAQEYLEKELTDEIENNPLNPSKFIESELDAASYVETVFLHSSPDGEKAIDDKKTHLVTNEPAGLKAAGLMAPGGSVGEDVSSVDKKSDDYMIEVDPGSESIQDLSPDTVEQPINSSVDPVRRVESIFSDDELARQAAALASMIDIGGPDGRR
jgi:hypothetical protein